MRRSPASDAESRSGLIPDSRSGMRPASNLVERFRCGVARPSLTCEIEMQTYLVFDCLEQCLCHSLVRVSFFSLCVFAVVAGDIQHSPTGHCTGDVVVAQEHLGQNRVVCIRKYVGDSPGQHSLKHALCLDLAVPPSPGRGLRHEAQLQSILGDTG